MTNALIEFRQVILTYGKGERRTVIGPLDLEVFENEALGIIGESGAGKSTAALEMLGLLALKEGARVAGEVKNRLAPREISYIPQDPLSALDPLFSIGSQLAESGAGKDLVREALTRVHLPLEKISLQSYPHELSGGMRQRVVIAMALLHKPRLIIADEPTSSLDMTLQAEVMKLFRQIRNTGVSFVFITHNLPLAANFCDRLLVMKNGKKIETGTPAQIMENPREPYTCQLVESSPRLHL